VAEIVLDASVVLAAVFKERGYEALLDLKEMPLVSTVNLAEVRARLSDRGLDRSEIDAALSFVKMTIVDFSVRQAVLSADLRPATRNTGLSLGDRACLALAREQDAVALTADRAWANLDVPVEIRMVR
jgi:PIN domain nuclease of toxin-antitoxin system